MQTAVDELRSFAQQRAVLALQLAACAGAGSGLWVISERLAHATPETHSLFFVAALFFGLAVTRLVASAIEVLGVHCPRCDQLFHLAPRRPALRIRSCANCGLSAREGGASKV